MINPTFPPFADSPIPDPFEELRERVARLEARVTELEGPRTRRDIVNAEYDTLYNYLADEVPGVWMTPGSIESNLTGVSYVSDKLSRMATSGRVERKGGHGIGSKPLYRVPPKVI